MAIINNATPAQPVQTDSNNGMINLLAFIVFLLFIFALLYYGIPYIRSSFSGGEGAGPQINVPKNVDVNINKQ